jgi:hypothetical protein
MYSHPGRDLETGFPDDRHRACSARCSAPAARAHHRQSSGRSALYRHGKNKIKKNFKLSVYGPVSSSADALLKKENKIFLGYKVICD